MKKIILCALITLFYFISFSQQGFQNEIQKLNEEKQKEIRLIDQKGLPPNQRQAAISNIQAKYSKLENDLRVKYNKIESNNRYQQESKRIDEDEHRQREHQNQLERRKEATYQSQYQIKSFSNSMNSNLSSLANNMLVIELNRREKVASNFIRSNNDKLNSIIKEYKRIPDENFEKNISGTFSGFIAFTGKYSFLNNGSSETVIPCIIEVNNNSVAKVYPYKKKNFGIDVSNQSLVLIKGITSFYDKKNDRDCSLILLDPYQNNKTSKNEIIEGETAEIIIWSKKKKYKDLNIYIQELDKNGLIVREIKTQIIHAKKKSLILENKDKTITLNSGNKLLIFCEPTRGPYGFMSPYANPAKKGGIKEGKLKPIKIKRYIF